MEDFLAFESPLKAIYVSLAISLHSFYYHGGSQMGQPNCHKHLFRSSDQQLSSQNGTGTGSDVMLVLFHVSAVSKP